MADALVTAPSASEGDDEGSRVEWYLTLGSYDELIARRAARDADTEPA
jgi:hypothetical protein